MEILLFKSKEELIKKLSETIDNYSLNEAQRYLFNTNIDELSYQTKGDYFFAISKDVVSVLTTSLSGLYSLYDVNEIKSVIATSFGNVCSLTQF